jgi:hypothetical protein
MNEEQCLEEIRQVRPIISAIVQLIDLLEQAETKEEALVYISAITVNMNRMPADWQHGTKILDDIREGNGDYAKVRPNCVRLGVI